MLRTNVICQAGFLLLCIPINAQGITYRVTNLGTLGASFDLSVALGVNSHGQVVGESYAPEGFHAFLWTPTSPNGTIGSINDLGDLQGGYSSSSGKEINSVGQVVGYSNATSGFRAFLWSPKVANGISGSMIDLGELPGGDDYSDANAINSYGQVVGSSEAETGGRAYLWTPETANGSTGSMVDLGELPGGENKSGGVGINSIGQVVGASNVAGGHHAFLWSPLTPNGTSGFMIDLGDLPEGLDESTAISINSFGQVVGLGHAASGTRAFLWTPITPNGTSGAMIDLGDLPGGSDFSVAYSINSHGQVVGASQSSALNRAFLWTPTSPNGLTGSMRDLNTMLDPISGLGWTLRIRSWD